MENAEDQELVVCANFTIFREELVEHARTVGAIPWNAWLHQAHVVARHFPDDAPPRGRNLEYSRIRSEKHVEAIGPDWRQEAGAR
eukprot:3393708-Alexandrium_andersonii.AAC.1